ncbi:MAG TPA: STAS domain-containing protein [Jatrophihabitans sp.]|jgi:anti-anti-sigma factor
MAESAPGGDQPVLTMTGDVDIATEPEWRRQGRQLLQTYPDMRQIVIDMAAVSFLDSRGMAVLVDLHTEALRRGGKLTLLAVPRRVFKALNIAGLDQVFQIESA